MITIISKIVTRVSVHSLHFWTCMRSLSSCLLGFICRFGRGASSTASHETTDWNRERYFGTRCSLKLSTFASRSIAVSFAWAKTSWSSQISTTHHSASSTGPK